MARLIDKYRLKKLLALRRKMKEYEADLKWINENEGYFSNGQVESYKNGLFELMAITNDQAVNLVNKLGEKIKEFEK